MVFFVVFVSPIATGAGLNLLSGIGEHFRAAGSQVICVGCGLCGLPQIPAVYTVGVLGYAFITGACSGAAQGLVFETIGSGNPVAVSQSALLLGAAFFRMSYTTWIDGQGFRFFGVAGLLGTDAALAICAAIFLFFFLRRFRRPQTSNAMATLSSAA